MEYSKKLNLALPSRDNDVDLADINQISENFRIIDENIVAKSDIDAELSATSENPVQNKAIKAGLDSKLDNTAGAVKSANLADGCVSWNHIGDGQVTTPAIALNSIYTRHIVDGNVTEEKLSADVAAQINSIGAVKVDRLDIDTAEDGIYVTKIIYSLDEYDFYSTIYEEDKCFFVLKNSGITTIFSLIGGIFQISENGTKCPHFNSTVSEMTSKSLNAPTTAAVYSAIQEALYVNTEEVIA